MQLSQLSKQKKNLHIGSQKTSEQHSETTAKFVYTLQSTANNSKEGNTRTGNTEPQSEIKFELKIVLTQQYLYSCMVWFNYILHWALPRLFSNCTGENWEQTRSCLPSLLVDTISILRKKKKKTEGLGGGILLMYTSSQVTETRNCTATSNYMNKYEICN